MGEPGILITMTIPAPGWYVIVDNPGAGEERVKPLACWALYTDAGETKVRGMVAVDNRDTPDLALVSEGLFIQYGYREARQLAKALSNPQALGAP